ncbi:MAG: metallophosphoesterase family protein [Thermoguttaceae bacterium]|jgi:exonuclease SbcD
MSIKFIHAADLHIDSPMKGLSEKDDAVAKKVREATRTAFKNLVDFAIDHKVAFVIIAGDVFDGDWDNVATGRWTGDQFKRLEREGVPVFITFGNHDVKNKIVRNMGKTVFPKNVYIFPSTAPTRKTYVDPASNERVAIVGQSYSNWFCRDNLAANYPPPEPDAFNIAILHTGLGGESAESYAPTSATELRRLGYDYWALGHQHSREILVDEPDCWVAYSGVLQTRHINECDNKDGRPGKGFFLVEIADGRRVGEPEFYSVDAFRWGRVTIDLSELNELPPEIQEQELVELFQEKAGEIVETADSRDVAVRVRLVGRSNLYGKITSLSLRDSLFENMSSSNAKVWIEGIDLSGVKPMIPDDFWEKGALKEIRDSMERQIDALSAVDSSELALKAENTPLPALADLVKRLWSVRDELRGEEGDEGIALTDSRQFAKWSREALDVLADALKTEEEAQN